MIKCIPKMVLYILIKFSIIVQHMKKNVSAMAYHLYHQFVKAPNGNNVMVGGLNGHI